VPNVGLVLGGGGLVGHAFHAGVLRALAEATGWDPRSADLIVGTSAGAYAGAQLRAGLSAADMSARIAGQDVSAEGTPIYHGIGWADVLHGPRLRSLRMASPMLALRCIARPWQVGRLAAGMLPRGRVSLEEHAARLRAFFGGWSQQPLWVCALRLDDGRRVVFGRDEAPATDVGSAVAASCAIPGWFCPVEIAGRWYVDGGAHSPTNLDVVAGEALDLVVAVSPMSAARGAWRAAVDLPARKSLSLLLREEGRRVHRRGTPVVAIEPTGRDLEVMGLNAMNHRLRLPVVLRAYESTLRRLELPEWRERLAALTAMATVAPTRRRARAS
jgi:NTE family protein